MDGSLKAILAENTIGGYLTEIALWSFRDDDTAQVAAKRASGVAGLFGHAVAP